MARLTWGGCFLVALISGLAAVPAHSGCRTKRDTAVAEANRMTSEPPVLEIKFSQNIDMATGQTARLPESSLEILLVEAKGPPTNCFDCPNRATLKARMEGKVEEMRYTLSGNMPLETMERARRRLAHGYVFFMVRIVEGAVTLRIEPVRDEQQ